MKLSEYKAQAQAVLDHWLGQAKSEGIPMACTNCTRPSCCRQRVLAYSEELDDLANYVHNVKPELVGRVRAFVEKWLKLSEAQQTDVLSQYDLHMNCPFLVNGRCAVYEVRPFVCQTHYAFEEDEGPCNAAKGAGPPVRLLDAVRLHVPLVRETTEFMPLGVAARIFRGTQIGEKCRAVGARMNAAWARELQDSLSKGELPEDLATFVKNNPKVSEAT